MRVSVDVLMREGFVGGDVWEVWVIYQLLGCCFCCGMFCKREVDAEPGGLSDVYPLPPLLPCSSDLNVQTCEDRLFDVLLCELVDLDVFPPSFFRVHTRSVGGPWLIGFSRRPVLCSSIHVFLESLMVSPLPS